VGPRLLPPDEVHLWCAGTEIGDPALVAAYQRLLTREEAARYARFLVEEPRRQYLVTRALVRTVLSRYVAIPPEAWTFVRNEHGRPEVGGPPGAERLRFSLSNTRGLVVCAVARTCEVGVDVEDLESRVNPQAIARQFLSPVERSALESLPIEEQRRRFFEYWTLKEAYLKARGLGLSLPLDQFSFHLGEGGLIRISFDSGLDDDPRAWQFTLLAPTARHLLAVAIHTQGTQPLRGALFHTVPLQEDVTSPGPASAGLEFRRP
jgi:4'-phosphopantetheinyl transferase